VLAIRGESLEIDSKCAEELFVFVSKEQPLCAVLDTDAQQGATGTPIEILSRTGTSLKM